MMISDTIYEHLRDIHSTKVRSLLSKATSIEPTDTISQVINKMTKNKSYDAFYLNGKTILSTNTRELLNSKNISTMKIEPYLYSIRYVTPNDSVQKAANILANYRVRAVPVVDKRKIVGVVTAKRILKLLASKDNRWIKANLIYTKNPVTITSNDSLSTARRIMTSKRIDHLPVDYKGTIKQVLTSSHLLDTILPKEGLGRKSRGVDQVRKLESRIGNVGSTRIPQCSPNDDLNTIVSSMLKTDTSCCLVNLWDKLQGIITYRDILSLLATKMESPIPLYIVGMPEDQRNVDLITSKFNNTLKRLAKVYSEIQEAKVSIKQGRTRSGAGSRKSRNKGNRAGKYEISIMITTPHHATQIFKSVGFDLSETLEELSQKLLKTLSKRAKRRTKLSVRKVGLPIAPI